MTSKYNQALRAGVNNKVPGREMARKIFLCYPTNVFVDREDLQYEIINDISKEFGVPFTHVQVVGSSKSGYSYVKNQPFVEGESDLDIAIIDSQLFTYYWEICCSVTKNLSDLTKFDNFEQKKSFVKYISIGMFRPDMMPRISERRAWFEYFNGLSSRYYKVFKGINAGIYCSEFFFESKNSSIMKDFEGYRI